MNHQLKLMFQGLKEGNEFSSILFLYNCSTQKTDSFIQSGPKVLSILWIVLLIQSHIIHCGSCSLCLPAIFECDLLYIIAQNLGDFFTFF